MISLICGIKKKQKQKTELIVKTDWRLLEVGVGGGKMGEWGQKVQNFQLYVCQLYLNLKKYRYWYITQNQEVQYITCAPRSFM